MSKRSERIVDLIAMLIMGFALLITLVHHHNTSNDINVNVWSVKHLHYQSEVNRKPVQEPERQYIEFLATAYCGCEHCCGKWGANRQGVVIGAAGVPLVEGVSIAVDNSIYKFGTEFVDESGHTYIAADTGGAIKGNRIDVYFDSHQDALVFGRQTVYLEVIPA